MTALRDAIFEKENESQKHLSILDAKLEELESLKKNIGGSSGTGRFVFLHIVQSRVGYRFSVSYNIVNHFKKNQYIPFRKLPVPILIFPLFSFDE